MIVLAFLGGFLALDAYQETPKVLTGAEAGELAAGLTLVLLYGLLSIAAAIRSRR